MANAQDKLTMDGIIQDAKARLQAFKTGTQAVIEALTAKNNATPEVDLADEIASMAELRDSIPELPTVPVMPVVTPVETPVDAPVDAPVAEPTPDAPVDAPVDVPVDAPLDETAPDA